MASRSGDGRSTGAVACPHWLATETGRDVLAAGGNALDAAVAMNAMLAVVYPHMCGLGGDLFLLYAEARTGRLHCLNASGPAPALATVAALRARGLAAVPVRGPLTATVPGAVAGWQAALERLGTRPLGDLLAPAAAVAEEGAPFTARLAAWIAEERADLAGDPVLRERLLAGDGAPPAAGATLRQPELARTLRRLIDAGADDLYRGALAAEIDRACHAAGGFLRAGDLAAYEPEWVMPVRAAHRGVEVVTTPPNSQGITALLMLNALRALGADGLEPGSAEAIEAFLTAKRAAFADRDRHVADPAFVAIDTDALLAPEHAAEALRDVRPPAPAPTGGDTVYLCAVDAAGNACSLIQSIYYAFGSCFTAGDTGILLHNRAHHFTTAEGHPNRLEPGKRPLHTLMASIALRDGAPWLLFGAMGADAQPQANVQVLARVLAGATPAEAVAAPRVRHGRFALEDDAEVLQAEEDLGADTIAALRARGHHVVATPPRDERMGHAHAIRIGPDGRLAAGSDPRSDGAALVL
jgi:gamma-glutamyltranspeptidase / glutathione hydrolase